jgi:hypothetical protein
VLSKFWIAATTAALADDRVSRAQDLLAPYPSRATVLADEFGPLPKKFPAKRAKRLFNRRVFLILLQVQIQPACELPQSGRAYQIADLPNFQLRSSAGAKVVWLIRGPAQSQDGRAFFVLRVLTS